MDIRLALYQLAAQHRLDAAQTEKLRQLAGLRQEPAALSDWVPRGVAILAAALAGLGLIFWVAANWEWLGRFGRFALLQGLFLLTCLGALWLPKARLPLLLLAMLAIGGLFAYFGQTYQTGADPWQLFALWALLALPLCFSARSDVLWMPWALIVIGAIALWIHARTGHRWRVEADDLALHLTGWLLALGLSFALAPPLLRFTGAGQWSLRFCLLLVSVMMTMTALGALFRAEVGAPYWLALLLLGGAVFALCQPRCHESFGLSAAVLALNVLLVAGLARFLFFDTDEETSLRMMMLGLAAAALLAGSVRFILLHTRSAQAAP